MKRILLVIVALGTAALACGTPSTSPESQSTAPRAMDMEQYTNDSIMYADNVIEALLAVADEAETGNAGSVMAVCVAYLPDVIRASNWAERTTPPSSMDASHRHLTRGLALMEESFDACANGDFDRAVDMMERGALEIEKAADAVPQSYNDTSL